MKTIYLDHAATTPIRPEVITSMTEYMATYIGNPSATHSFGRSVKSALETARKKIASHLNASSNEIIFTSGATESLSWIINSCVANGIKRVITSKIEHHAVLETLTSLETKKAIKVDYVSLEAYGTISLTNLGLLLQSNDIPTLVCLMHTNNETGTITDIKTVASICKNNNALFLCDTVQAIGKTKIDVQTTEVDFLIASSHKFHGPKGIGFIYKRKNQSLSPLFYGGGQEKGLRAGTENVHAILGMTDALSISYHNLETEQIHLQNIKQYTISELFLHFPGVQINGTTEDDADNHILNITLPFAEKKASLIVFMLDMKGIAISRGSACQSGSNLPSHVLKEFLSEKDLLKPAIRISFSYQTSYDDIDFFIESLEAISKN